MEIRREFTEFVRAKSPRAREVIGSRGQTFVKVQSKTNHPRGPARSKNREDKRNWTHDFRKILEEERTFPQRVTDQSPLRQVREIP